MTDNHQPQQTQPKPWIRGVNLGGWLVLERYITPYTFAITDCHTRGDFCWYPGQIDAPTQNSSSSKSSSIQLNEYDYKPCDISECPAVLANNVFGKLDYPMDEYHLAQAFSYPQDFANGDNSIHESHFNSTTRQAGMDWLNSHFEHFLQRDDLVKIKQAGMTHVRVPLPHWILGDIRDNEPWIAADRWKYFVRMCGWAREIGLQVWPNIHTAPGSQNGFDNSGVQNTVKTCGGWNDNNHNIQRSLDVIHEVTVAIRDANLTDVVTGFGLLNEPFGDCSLFKYKKFLEDGIRIVRSILGEDVSIYMSDLFQAHLFNDGKFGQDPELFNNTFLDSHYYNIFSQGSRSLSPREHIHYICEPDKGERVTDCCFQDGPDANQVPNNPNGLQRIVAEWSGAFDAMPGEVLKPIMKSIFEYGEAPLMDRQLSSERKSFLKKIIQAQIVSYEAADVGVAHGTFYWNFKMEGGAYAEWDFLRGVEEGWYPKIASPDVASETLYGTCQDIYNRTWESKADIVHAYPGDNSYWRGPRLFNQTDTIGPEPPKESPFANFWNNFDSMLHQIFLIAVAILVVMTWRRYSANKRSQKWQYTEIQT